MPHVGVGAGALGGRGPHRRSSLAASKARTVAAHYPNHVWNVDLAVVPIRGGFWSPLVPFAPPQVWPFYWWIAVAVDMFSRKTMGFAVFKRPPTSRRVQAFLDRAFAAAGVKPKYFVTDRGKQFDCEAFRKWCRRRRIKPRHGAVGRHGSIAVVERFNRTLKHEGLCQDRSASLGPAGHHHDSRHAMAGWERGVPHAARTVLINEVHFDREPAVEKPRWEPRGRWPRTSGCAAPCVPVRGECGARLELEVSYLEGRRHLPIFRLREAA